MSKLNYSATIAIDTCRSTLHYFSMLGNDINSIEHKIKNYTGLPFEEMFFTRFKDVIKEFSEEIPSESIRKISLIMPDNSVALDTINVPTLRSKSATRNALNLTLGGIYKNFTDLKVQANIAAQNRQYTTFSTVAIQKRILTALYAACSENKLLVDTTTYAAGATAGALAILNPKLKNASYLFLDIKDTYSRFVFVVNGRAAGYFHLPFGLEFLGRYKCVQEDMLFDHTMAELTVLNAREKAKAKKLTVLAEDVKQADSEADEVADNGYTAEAVLPQESEDSDHFEDSEENEQEQRSVMTEPFAMTSGQRITMPKIMAKKTPRKLPKFMQRPVPWNREGITYENFRVFVKWALTLIASNEKITSLGKPEFVCVNIPDEFDYIIDRTNEEQEENGIEFRLIGGAYEPSVYLNLELYGGFFPKAIHNANKL